MTYCLKLVRFKGRDCHILLQNENGPCPLLAASNGLLLQGRIELPVSATRAGSASLEDVTNMLANFAMQQQSTEMFYARKNQTNNTSGSHPCTQAKTVAQSSTVKTTTAAPAGLNKDDMTIVVSEGVEVEDDDVVKKCTMFYINELLHYIPKFQSGMDVNPKFTEGCMGYEYTAELTAFDMLQCKLVHGWLVDPYHDSATYHIIGRKSYNELIDTVITGKDQKYELQLSVLQSEIDTIRQRIETEKMSDYQYLLLQSQEKIPPQNSVYQGGTIDTIELPADQEKLEIDQSKLLELQSRYEQTQRHITEIHCMDEFLNTTCHQLTTYGLEALHEQIQPDEVCVFFRNNHFNTLYKHATNGNLYLLISDMGYSSSPNIVWEKLDVIDGDTEFCNDQFETHSPPNQHHYQQQQLLQSPQPSDNATTIHSTTVTYAAKAAGGATTAVESDYELAIRLSLEEERRRDSHNVSATNTSSCVQNLKDVKSGITDYVTNTFLPPISSSHSNNQLPQKQQHVQHQLGTTEAFAPFSLAPSTVISSTSGFDGGNSVVVPPDVSHQLLDQPHSHTINKPAPLTTSHNDNRVALSLVESADMMLAMQLQDYHQEYVSTYAYNSNVGNGEDASFQLARQLQEQEDRLAAIHAQNNQQKQTKNQVTSAQATSRSQQLQTNAAQTSRTATRTSSTPASGIRNTNSTTAPSSGRGGNTTSSTTPNNRRMQSTTVAASTAGGFSGSNASCSIM